MPERSTPNLAAIVAVAIAAVGLSACGSSSSAGPSTSRTPTTPAPAGGGPSTSTGSGVSVTGTASGDLGTGPIKTAAPTATNPASCRTIPGTYNGKTTQGLQLLSPVTIGTRVLELSMIVSSVTPNQATYKPGPKHQVRIEFPNTLPAGAGSAGGQNTSITLTADRKSGSFSSNIVYFARKYPHPGDGFVGHELVQGRFTCP